MLQGLGYPSPAFLGLGLGLAAEASGHCVPAASLGTSLEVKPTLAQPRPSLPLLLQLPGYRYTLNVLQCGR